MKYFSTNKMKNYNFIKNNFSSQCIKILLKSAVDRDDEKLLLVLKIQISILFKTEDFVAANPSLYIFGQILCSLLSQPCNHTCNSHVRYDALSFRKRSTRKKRDSKTNKPEMAADSSDDFSVLVLASDLGVDGRPFLSYGEEEEQENWHDCSDQYLSPDEDFSDLDLLQFFHLELSRTQAGPTGASSTPTLRVHVQVHLVIGQANCGYKLFVCTGEAANQRCRRSLRFRRVLDMGLCFWL